MASDEADWERCLEWIGRCGVLEDGHRLVKPGVKVYEFAPLLRDGVIICHLLNALVPGVLDQRQYSQRPSDSQFLCTKNIRVFLTKCREIFKIPEEDLFDNADLWHLKDMGKVIRTLSVLSNTEIALSSGIKGFHVSKQQDYEDLKGFANKAIEEDVSSSNYDEKIYQDVLSIKRHESTRTTALKVSSMTKREFCIKEIADTENSYIAVLNMVIEKFKNPLLSKIGQANSDVLFRHIDALQVIHVGFHSDLMKACHSRHGLIKSSGHMTIPDCFIKWKEKFLKYGDYCSDLNTVHALLDKLMSSSSTKDAITACQMAANQGKFRLWDLLSVPMQRVLKYHLLLKELVKHTDVQHPERKSLDKALDEMQDLAMYVNETKRDNENLALINSVQKSIVNHSENLDLLNMGHLQRDGDIRFRLGEEKKDKARYAFLFDKQLLVCKTRGSENYTLKETFEIAKSEVEEINPDGNKFGFYLKVLKKPPNGSRTECIIVFFLKSMELRKKWIDSFAEAMDNVCPEGSTNHRHHFVITSFSEPTICDVCRRLLRGVFFQGYKCKNTSMVVHKSCIVNAKNMEGPPTVPPRDSSGYRAKAFSSYQGSPQPPYNLPPLYFQENDIITITSTDHDPWWLGRNASQEGYFPKTFVQVVKRQGSAIAEDIQNLTLDTPFPSPGGHSPGPFVPLPDTAALPPSLPSKASRSTSLMVQSLNRSASPSTNRNTSLASSTFASGAPPAIVPRRITREPSACTPSIASPLPLVPMSAVSNAMPPTFLHGEFFEEDLAVFPWFVGDMTREKAAELLDKQQNGTYLVRISKTGDKGSGLSLSLKFNAVQHIRIQRNAERRWFLAGCKTFHAVQELIEFYQVNSLQQCFTEVPTTLSTAFKDTLADPDT